MIRQITFIPLLILLCCCTSPGKSVSESTDILIIGAGASGTMAAIQAARMGASVTLIEETPWLGGMLTSAGVSAVDGNYTLHSGLWEEFRQQLNAHYGGEEALKTGWVSHVLFEPQIGDSILKAMVAKEPGINLIVETVTDTVWKRDDIWEARLTHKDSTSQIRANVLIDATELGDIAGILGVPYDLGMDARSESGEEIAPLHSNDIIQDLTYVAVLKTYDTPEEAALTKPKGYDPTPFLCTCKSLCPDETLKASIWDCDYMMEYGRLPHGYYMINWPIAGNDFYLNLVEVAREDREKALEIAKNYTLQYVYFLQTELGFSHVGIANDIFPTEDGLPLIPYHRESRRIKGKVRFTVNDLARPFEQAYPLYRTGIAVGDYPIDHHHKAYAGKDSLPDLHFYPVPSYSLPLGTLIPMEENGLIVAEKSISVSNIVNGTTRLQPVCLLLGQAAGVLAALSIAEDKPPHEISVREVQKHLLTSEAYLMPYSDAGIDHKAFRALQKAGATGILRGDGQNIGWKNHTFIYPDSLLSAEAVKEGLSDWLPITNLSWENDILSTQEVLQLLTTLQKDWNPEGTVPSVETAKIILDQAGLPIQNTQQGLSRAQFAVLLDAWVNPFENRKVDLNGNFMN